MLRRLPLPLLLALLGFPLGAAAASPTLLEQAVERWLGERDHWAFTQRAVEFERDEARERLERYDPSKPAEARWTLLAINGRRPTPEEHAEWAEKKFKKKRRRFDSPIGDYFEFERARLLKETSESALYEVPLRADKKWLFEANKVRVTVTVNKERRALERLSAELRDQPLKILLGFAKVWDGVLDLTFHEDAIPGPAGAAPTGEAKILVTKLGERAEFTWTDFKRVTPHPTTVTRNESRQSR